MNLFRAIKGWLRRRMVAREVRDFNKGLVERGSMIKAEWVKPGNYYEIAVRLPPELFRQSIVRRIPETSADVYAVRNALHVLKEKLIEEVRRARAHDNKATKGKEE